MLVLPPTVGTLHRVPPRSIAPQRRCSRNGCRWPASATLTYSYDKVTVWVEDLLPQKQPNTYDLCAAHAERTTVPIGWIKEDLRVAPPPVTQLRVERPLFEAKQDPGETASA
jgi:hypothetical protein